jgi:hypothetical protein
MHKCNDKCTVKFSSGNLKARDQKGYRGRIISKWI